MAFQKIRLEFNRTDYDRSRHRALQCAFEHFELLGLEAIEGFIHQSPAISRDKSHNFKALHRMFFG
jgi:hypothetical protein